METETRSSQAKGLISLIKNATSEEEFHNTFFHVQELFDDMLENILDNYGEELSTTKNYLEYLGNLSKDELVLLTVLTTSYTYEGRYDGLTHLLREAMAYKKVMRFVNRPIDKSIFVISARVGGDEFFVIIINRQTSVIEFIFIDMSLLNFFNKDYELGNCALQVIAYFLKNTADSIHEGNSSASDFIFRAQNELLRFNEYVNDEESTDMDSISICKQYKERYRHMVEKLFGHYLTSIGLRADFGVERKRFSERISKDFLKEIAEVASNNSTKSKQDRRPVWIGDILTEYITLELLALREIKVNLENAVENFDVASESEFRKELVRIETNIHHVTHLFQEKRLKKINEENDKYKKAQSVEVKREIGLHPFLEFFSYAGKNLKVPLANIVAESCKKVNLPVYEEV